MRPLADIDSGALVQWSRRWVHRLARARIRGRRVHFGRRIHVGAGVVVDARFGWIRVGDEAWIGPRVCVIAGVEAGDPEGGGVSIERGAGVEADALLLPGAKIWAGALVARGAVVHGLVEAHAIVAGAPARVVGHRGRHPRELVFIDPGGPTGPGSRSAP